MNKKAFLAALSTIRPSATFLSIRGYQNSSGEVADFSIIFNMSYENALRRSIDKLNLYLPENDLELEAKQALLTSYDKSLTKIATTPVNELEDAYTRIETPDGGYLSGAKIHTETGELHLFGLLNSKKVHTPGVYKEVKSKPLTIAKAKLEKMLPVSKFRQFKINPEKCDSVIVEKMELLPPT